MAEVHALRAMPKHWIDTSPKFVHPALLALLLRRSQTRLSAGPLRQHVLDRFLRALQMPVHQVDAGGDVDLKAVSSSSWCSASTLRGTSGVLKRSFRYRSE